MTTSAAAPNNGLLTAVVGAMVQLADLRIESEEKATARHKGHKHFI